MTHMMQEYFDRKSRAPSPSLSRANAMWYSAQPNLEAHDRVVVKGFLNLFQNHIPETFSLFDESTINSNNKARPEYILAMAATGGLFCSVPGSAQITKSMYNDARRLTLASVRLSFRK